MLRKLLSNILISKSFDSSKPDHNHLQPNSRKSSSAPRGIASSNIFRAARMPWLSTKYETPIFPVGFEQYLLDKLHREAVNTASGRLKSRSLAQIQHFSPQDFRSVLGGLCAGLYTGLLRGGCFALRSAFPIMDWDCGGFWISSPAAISLLPVCFFDVHRERSQASA